MKTLMLICLASISFLSCQKKENKKYCWQCSWIYQPGGHGYSSQNKDELRQVCDKTDAEIEIYEQEEFAKPSSYYRLIGCTKE